MIKLFANGKVADFAMNDKCAAGTGRFLEVMASALEVEWPEIGELVSLSQTPTKISSFCTVFAESEVISQVSAGESKANILADVCASVAGRVASMTRHTGLEPDIAFTGGVAHNAGITAALGAALLAKELNK